MFIIGILVGAHILLSVSAVRSFLHCVVMGAMLVMMKCRRGNGTRFAWISFRSTLSSPSKRSDAV